MDELPILIAGGGIGGLTAAIAIARNGLPVRVLERAPAFEPIGYGIQLGPNALHTFHQLGLTAAILERSSLPEAGLLSDAISNESLARLPMADVMVARFGQPYAVIHRGDLHQVLLESCAALPQIEFQNNCEVVRYQDDGNYVSVESQGGARMRGSVLIGADGIWSQIRRQLFPDADLPFTTRYVAFRCLCPIGEVGRALASNVINLRCGANFHMIHYPLRGGTLFNLVAGVRVPDKIDMGDHSAVVAHLEQAFSGACGEIQALLPLVDRSRFWAVANFTPLREWVCGRVALMGDSAHAMVQAMAQGACQAIEDAYVLAKHLASDVPMIDALSRYQTERHIRATYTQYRSHFMWDLIHAGGGWRDLRRAKLAGMTTDDILSCFDWLYAGSPDSELGRELQPIGSDAPQRYVRTAGIPHPTAASAFDR